MKKPISQLSRITEYIKENPFSKASDIQKGLKFKSNIYTLLGLLVDRGVLRKTENKTYAINGDIKIAVDKTDSLDGEKLSKTITINAATQPISNPYANILKREIDHIQSGIDQLMITKNYLERRLEQLQS